MLPVKDILSLKIQNWVNSQKSIDPTSEDPVKAFGDGLAEIILDTIKSADVIGVSTQVTGVAGSIPVAGTGVQNNKAKLQ